MLAARRLVRTPLIALASAGRVPALVLHQASPAQAQEAPLSADAQTQAIVAGAEAFLATLSEDQRDLVLYGWRDDAQRANWTNLPEGGSPFPRGGLRWGDMDDAQRAALTALLGGMLSFDGLRNVQEQIAADDVVAATDAEDGAGGPPDGERPPVSFGSAYCFVSMLGEPSETAPWMMQFDGHHLAIDATVAGPDLTLAPSLTGGQPLRFEMAGQEVWIVEEEVTDAAALIASLSEEQRAAAVRGEGRIDLVLGPGQDGRMLEPDGLAAADMTAAQRAGLLALIEARLGIMNADDLAATMAPIAANLDETYLACSRPSSSPPRQPWPKTPRPTAGRRPSSRPPKPCWAPSARTSAPRSSSSSGPRAPPPPPSSQAPASSSWASALAKRCGRTSPWTTCRARGSGLARWARTAAPPPWPSSRRS